MRRGSITAALYLLVVFLSGILLGGFGMSLYSARSADAARNNPKQEDRRRRWERDMQTRLKLTPEQSSKFESILQETREQFDALNTKWRPEAKSIMDNQYESIRAILNDDQKAEYEKMRQEREAHRRQGIKKGPPPHP